MGQLVQPCLDGHADGAHRKCTRTGCSAMSSSPERIKVDGPASRTGRLVSLVGLHMDRVRDGRICEHRANFGLTDSAWWIVAPTPPMVVIKAQLSGAQRTFSRGAQEAPAVTGAEVTWRRLETRGKADSF